MALLGVVGGVLGFGVTRLFEEQTYKNDVVAVVERLRLAQDVMLIYQTDVVVTLNADPSGMRCHMRAEAPLPDAVAKAFDKGGSLKGIVGVDFNDSRGAVEISFVSNGSKMSRGILTLRGKQGRERYIALKGAPAFIEAAATMPTWSQERHGDSDALYPLPTS